MLQGHRPRDGVQERRRGRVSREGAVHPLTEAAVAVAEGYPAAVVPRNLLELTEQLCGEAPWGVCHPGHGIGDLRRGRGRSSDLLLDLGREGLAPEGGTELV